jgi:hypothetical protein
MLSAAKDRAEPLGEAALDQALGIAFFCCLDNIRRFRVERKELLPLFGADTPPGNVAHLVSDEEGEPILYRIYQAQGSVSHTVQRLREHINQAKHTKRIKPYLEAGLYGMAVLVPERNRLKPVSDAIQRHKLKELCPIICGVGPTSSTLAAELRRSRA